MANYKQLFINYMETNGIKYTDRNEYSVKVSYSGDNMQSIPVYVFFDEDGDPLVTFKCWDIANFKSKTAAGMLACNTMNNEYRWVKFYIDDDCDVICSCDAYIDAGTCGSECLSLVQRVVSICDKAYPTFMRALYN